MAPTKVPELSRLLKSASLQDHEEYLAAADAVLKASKGDLLAQHVRLVALLKLDRYQEAQQAVDEGDRALADEAPFEVAYTFYKNGKSAEADKLIANKDGQIAWRHVEAQNAYRAEDFGRALSLYKKIVEESQEDISSDIRINSGATDAQLAWSGQHSLTRNKKASREDLEQFETTFNAACLNIARGELKQAEILLSRAKDLCNASDDLSSEEKKQELLPITVQQIYVASALGKTEETAKLRESVDIAGIPGLDTKHIAQNNDLVAAGSLSNPYLSHRLFHSTSNLPTKDRTFNFQGYILRQNTWTLDLLTSKNDGVRASTAKFITKHAESASVSEIAHAGVLNAAAHAHTQTGKTALKEILPLLEQRPHDIGLLLTIVQLYLLTNNVAIATSLLERFMSKLQESKDSSTESLRFAPGLVALLVSLYAQQNRTVHTKAELAKAATYWRHKSKTWHDSAPLLKAAGTALLDSSTEEERSRAHELFKYINTHEPNDKSSIAGLMASENDVGDQQLSSSTSQLPSIEKLIADIDVTALEGAGVARPPSSDATTTTAGRKRQAEAPAPSATAKVKKIRPSRLPKNYNEAKQPDPERWLPLRDRSTWRPKGKKKSRAGGGGGSTQGGLVSEESSRPATPSQVQAAPASKGKNKKKSKK